MRGMRFLHLLSWKKGPCFKWFKGYSVSHWRDWLIFETAEIHLKWHAGGTSFGLNMTGHLLFEHFIFESLRLSQWHWHCVKWSFYNTFLKKHSSEKLINKQGAALALSLWEVINIQASSVLLKTMSHSAGQCLARVNSDYLESTLKQKLQFEDYIIR